MMPAKRVPCYRSIIAYPLTIVELKQDLMKIPMNDVLQTAKSTLLDPTGIEAHDLDGLIGRLMAYDIDYADLYFQYSRSESWSLEDGAVKSGSRSIDQGVGIRAVSGEKTGFAYSDEFHLPALTKAADAARAIARSGGKTGQALSWQKSDGAALYAPADPLASLPDDAKVTLLQQVEAEARRQDPRVSQVMASLAAVHDVVLIARNDGFLAADIRPLVRLNVHVIVESNGRREQGSAGGGGRFGYGWLQADERALHFARDAVRQALVNLEAVDSSRWHHDRGVGSRVARNSLA